MFCTDYALSYTSQPLREYRSITNWSIKTMNNPSLLDLEQEIRMLRRQMELMFQEEQSFTADNVIEISSILDVKINEYMKSSVKA